MSGGSGAEAISAGDDADLVSTGSGDDTVVLGAGDDTAIQTAGDGFDALEGQSGSDTLRVVGSAESEEFTVQAVGTRARISRDSAPATAEFAGIEAADVSAAGGPDLVDIGDLSGTELERVDADVGLADGARDQVAAQGGRGPDFLDARASGEGLLVRGLPEIELRVENSRAADDRLTPGRDVLTAGTTLGTLIALTLDGGAGADRLRVSGSNAGETLDVSANGPRVRLAPNVGAIALDIDGVERVDAGLLGGADRLAVGDLSGTDLTTVNADLAANSGGGAGDNATDEITVNASDADDAVTAARSGSTVNVAGLAARIAVARAETRDLPSINALGGRDSIDGTGLPVAGIRFQGDGGDGDDTLQGGPGYDVLQGRDGADALFAGGGDNVALGGAGDDVLRGEEGDDLLDGGADDDVLIGGPGDDVLLNGEVVFDD